MKKPAKNLDPIGNHNTQHALAIALQLFFGDKIAIVIDDEAVKSWRKGARLDRGTPPPPAKRGNYFIGEEWRAWVEKWIIPKHGHNSSGADLAQLAQEAKYRTIIIEEQKEKIALEILDEKYFLKDAVNRMADNAAQTLNAVQNNRLELRARVSIKEKFAAAGIPEDQKIVDLVCDYLKETNALLKEELRAALVMD